MSYSFERPIHLSRLTNIYGFVQGTQYIHSPYVSPYEGESDEYRLTLEVDPYLMGQLTECFEEARGFSHSERTQNWREGTGRYDQTVVLRSVIEPKLQPGLNYDKSELDLSFRIDQHTFCVAGARPEVKTYENVDGTVVELETLVLAHSIDVYRTFEDACSLTEEGEINSASGLVFDF